MFINTGVHIVWYISEAIPTAPFAHICDPSTIKLMERQIIFNTCNYVT